MMRGQFARAPAHFKGLPGNKARPLFPAVLEGGPATGGNGGMVAEVEGARRWANWGFERQQPGWIGRLSNIALILAAAGAVAGALYGMGAISGTQAQAVTSTIVALAVISGFAAFAARASARVCFSSLLLDLSFFL